MGDNKKKIRVAPISTKNIMKNSRHSSVDNDYCASTDMRRQGVTSRSMRFAPQNQVSTCEDKVRLFYAIKKEMVCKVWELIYNITRNRTPVDSSCDI